MFNIKYIISLFIGLLVTSCVTNENPENVNKKYKTCYIIYWASDHCPTSIIYTDDSVYTCSFQGTNFLLEKNNPTELFSTTAPIKIISCSKNNE